MYLINSIKILKEYERGVIFRLGRVLSQPKGPGLIFVFAPIDKIAKISLRVITLDVAPQDIITKDNVSVKVNAVVYYRVMEPIKAVTEIENYNFATSQISQTTLRSVVGQAELDELLSDREKINMRLQDIIDKQTDPWGIKVSTVEIKHVDLPQEMQRAMAKQAEAERERRAKIIAAEGEFQASEKLSQAAKVLAQEPISLQMRYLQTLVEISAEKSSTILFPIPLDLIKPFLERK
jgi:regulator of protease activity HflC (stomatin/prohibitin superfamily)